MKPAQITTKVAWESWNEALLQKTEKLIISERMAQQELRRLDFSGNNLIKKYNLTISEMTPGVPWCRRFIWKNSERAGSLS